MPIIRHTMSAVAAAMAFFAFAVPAFATPGVMKQSVNVYAQASQNAAAIGSLDSGQPINIAGCNGGWCKVSSGGVSGWIDKSAITFKGIIPTPTISLDSGVQAPQPNQGNGNGNNQGNGNNNGPGFNFDFGFGNDNSGPFPPGGNYDPRPPRPQPQQSQACFYSGTNFRGDSFCVDRGQSYNYLPDDWDNEIRSVEIFGRARVDLCRDEDLEGACATLRSSQSRLPNQIDRRVSSLEVY